MIDIIKSFYTYLFNFNENQIEQINDKKIEKKINNYQVKRLDKINIINNYYSNEKKTNNIDSYIIIETGKPYVIPGSSTKEYVLGEKGKRYIHRTNNKNFYYANGINGQSYCNSFRVCE